MSPASCKLLAETNAELWMQNYGMHTPCHKASCPRQVQDKLSSRAIDSVAQRCNNCLDLLRHPSRQPITMETGKGVKTSWHIQPKNQQNGTAKKHERSKSKSLQPRKWTWKKNEKNYWGKKFEFTSTFHVREYLHSSKTQSTHFTFSFETITKGRPRR